MSNRWTCPYCNKPQIITDNSSSITGRFWLGKSNEQPYGLRTFGILCANTECQKLSVTLSVGAIQVYTSGEFYSIAESEPLFEQQVLPQGKAKPQPEYIPRALREDYREACLIRDLSPKAAATLIRRCLQGMIRDFTGIKCNTLYEEVKALRTAVNEGSADRAVAIETVDAIDHVRGVGNIGAHMERDIDLIVPVDPGEAQALIELVEMLFDEWYVARHTRQQRFAKISEIADSKKLAKQPSAKALPARELPIGDG